MAIMLTEASINVFYEINKKKDNDNTNKIREEILFQLLEQKTIPKKWYKNKQWFNLQQELFKCIGIATNDYKIEKKGGRNYNYDFIIDDKKIEFKYNSAKIDKCPQFLSISSNNFCKDEGYASFFYDNYIHKIAKLLSLDLPKKDEYLKYIYNNNYEKLSFFKDIKANEHLIKTEKNKIVKESIGEYLHNHLHLDIEKLNEVLKNKEENKYYLLYKNGSFKFDKIHENELEIVKIEKIKNNNCLILQTKSNTKIGMLLRWKNHIGILYPAWQISLINR